MTLRLGALLVGALLVTAAVQTGTLMYTVRTELPTLAAQGVDPGVVSAWMRRQRPVGLTALLAPPLVAALVLALFTGRLGTQRIRRVTDALEGWALGDSSEGPAPGLYADLEPIEQALSQARRSVEESLCAARTRDEIRRRIVADMSHELANPLNAVLCLADRLAEASETDRSAVLTSLEGEVHRLGKLARDLRALGAAEQPALRHEFHPTDVAALARDVVARARHRGQRVELSTPERLIAHVDALRLEQAISNLLDNANLHTPAGTTAQVKLHHHEGLLLVDVEDSGPQLSDRRLARLRAGRPQVSEARRAQGHGRGLSIVRTIAENHGGRFELHRGRTGGLVAQLRLPLGNISPASTDYSGTSSASMTARAMR